ncbi:N-6 DNA methylase [soil metagenome]
MDERLLISTSDIADLVDERLPVVSTWRNRFKSGDNAFPQPAGGSPARPLFDFVAVQRWIQANRPDKDVQSGLLRIRVWSGIRLMSASSDQFDLVYWLHLVMHVRKLELSDMDAASIEGIQDPSDYTRTLFPTGIPDEIGTIEGLISDATKDELVEVSDFTLRRLSAGYGRSGGTNGAVESDIAMILATATMGHSTVAGRSPLIYDSSCGIGEALINTVDFYNRRGQGQATVIGTEINARIAAIASIRFELRDIPATIRIADSLSTQQFFDRQPDIVMAEPPLGLHWVGVWSPDDPRSRFGIPPASSADLAWVQDAAARLTGNARAYVLTGTSSLAAGGAAERVRAGLIRAGAVETVFALPPNLLQYTSMALALWVLRAPSTEGSAPLVTLVDASNPDLDSPGVQKRTDWLLENIAYWVIDPTSADRADGVLSAVIHYEALLEEGSDLTPNRWTSQPDVSGLAERLYLDNLLFSSDISGFQPEAPDFDPYDGILSAAQHIVTVGEMTDQADSREAKLWNGRGVSNDEVTADTITSRDISAAKLPESAIDHSTEAGFWTEPGDIVFTTMNKVRALVDIEGGHRIGNGVHALRLLRPSRFDPEYVARCLAASWNERHQKGATIKHAKVADLEIPLLPIDAQRQWVTEFGKLRDLVAAAHALIESASDVEQSAERFLRFGRPESHNHSTNEGNK